MSDKNISERLKALATGKNRSATARLRERFDEIDVALRAGARRRDVYQALKEDGIAITFESFELAIYRLRKGRSEQQKHQPGKPSVPSCPIAAKVPGKNPLHALSGKPKEGEFNPVPPAKIEIDNS